jgi:hypothetical protein
MRASLICATILVLASAECAFAQEAAGRYQMVVTESNGGVSSVLILDTREGNLWQWTESHPVAQQPKEWVTYLGRLVPAPASPKAGNR